MSSLYSMPIWFCPNNTTFCHILFQLSQNSCFQFFAPLFPLNFPNSYVKSSKNSQFFLRCVDTAFEKSENARIFHDLFTFIFHDLFTFIDKEYSDFLFFCFHVIHFNVQSTSYYVLILYIITTSFSFDQLIFTFTVHPSAFLFISSVSLYREILSHCTNLTTHKAEKK